MTLEMKHPHVAIVETALLVNNFGSGLRVVVIFLHHIWTFRKDFPVFCYLDVNVRDRLSVYAILKPSRRSAVRTGAVFVNPYP